METTGRSFLWITRPYLWTLAPVPPLTPVDGVDEDMMPPLGPDPLPIPWVSVLLPLVPAVAERLSYERDIDLTDEDLFLLLKN